MISAVNHAMLAAANWPAASTLVKATVIAVLGLIGVRFARRNRAAVRHALLAVSLGALLVLPVASIVAPPLRIVVPIAAPARIVAAPFPGTAPASSRIELPGTGVGVWPAMARSSNLSLPALFFTGWIAGAMLFLLPMAVGLQQVRSLRRSSLPWQSGQSAANELVRLTGIRRHVEVLLHEELPGPMTCGAARPAILMPLDAQNWEREDLNRAIVHELEHVRRRDWASHCLARAVCAIYWFHPLVWIMRRQFELEAERSCDDAVLGHSEATAYADQLVGLAQRLSSAAKSPMLAMAKRADLAARVNAVLDSRQRRGRAGMFPVAAACAAAAVLVLTISPLQMVAAPQSAADTPPTAMPQFSVADMLVIEDVTVSDPNGNPIEGLTPNDFVVTEDGRPQKIQVFEFQRLAASQGTPGAVSSYYILGYYTPNETMDGKFRTVQITRKGDTTSKLDYRLGYYAMKYFPRTGAILPGPGTDSTSLDPSAPLLVYKKGPEYAEEARKAKYQGTVHLDVDIDTSGNVTGVRVVRSLGLGLDEKAIDAVKQWKFRPAMKNGSLVAVQARVDVSFRLL